jgi:hypothetical protein
MSSYRSARVRHRFRIGLFTLRQTDEEPERVVSEYSGVPGKLV